VHALSCAISLISLSINRHRVINHYLLSGGCPISLYG
jgi:hypothetical protein